MSSESTKRSQSHVVSGSLNFKELGVSRHLCGVLAARGYDKPTDIQKQALPEIIAGKDVLGIAQTGTGKTGAFCLPVLERLFQDERRAERNRPQVLVVAPTRELVSQIVDEAKAFVGGRKIRCFGLTGGVSQRPQEAKLNRGIEILVATPGRLLDLAGQGFVELGSVSCFVLDEADQLLDMGFIRDINRILKLLPRQRQSLLFSATMPKAVETLAHRILQNPVRIEVTPRKITVESIRQGYVQVESKLKQQALQVLLAQQEVRKAIVFARTKHGANRVAEKLDKQGVCVEVIHGNKSQNARNRALNSFKSGDAWVLVATDVAARGIDIRDVTHVINFDLPQEPEVYVHRIGRTARAGAEGVAWSLVDREERSLLKKIERLTKISISKVLLEAAETGDDDVSATPDDEADRPKRRRRRRRRRKIAKTPREAA